MAPRTRAAARFALLELNDDLLRSVLLLCGVDSLRALHRVSTKLRKLSHETLRLAKWRELPGNADALRDALWLAGQFTTRIVGASNSDSMNEAFIQDGRLIASNHSDEVSCFESKTGRFVFGMDVEVGKIAVQGDTLAIGLMGLFPDSDSGVQIWAWQGEELSLIKELETAGYTCTGLGWLGPGVLITHTAVEDEVTLQMWKGPEWEEAHRNTYAMIGGFPEPWENGISLEVQEKEQRVFTTLTRNASLARDPDAEETAAAEIYFWDPERLGECIGEHVEDGLEWLCKDGRLLVASGDYCAGALTEMAHSSADAIVKVWMIDDSDDDDDESGDESGGDDDSSGLVRWCTFPAENRVTFQLLLLGDLLVCSARVGADPALAINSVSQRATLRTVRFPVLSEIVPPHLHARAPPHLHAFDETGSTLIFSTDAPIEDSVEVSSEFDERLGVSVAQLSIGARASKLLVHELSGIW